MVSSGDAGRGRVDRAGRLAEHQQLRQQGAGLLAGQGHAEQVLELAGEDDHGYARGEADGHRIGDELYVGADPEIADRHQNDAGHQRRQQQPVHAVAVDAGRHQHDEGAGRAADLEAAAAQRRDEEAADDRREKTPVRRDAGSDRDRHRQRQRDDRHGEAGGEIGAELGHPIALAQHRNQLGREEIAEAWSSRRGNRFHFPGLHERQFSHEFH